MKILGNFNVCNVEHAMALKKNNLNFQIFKKLLEVLKNESFSQQSLLTTKSLHMENAELKHIQTEA